MYKKENLPNNFYQKTPEIAMILSLKVFSFKK